jgi:hypothetical protein
MSDPHADYRKSIDDWADQWEKAQADGVFDGAPTLAGNQPQTSTNSFFGLVDSRPSDDVSEPDAEYWRKVIALGDQDPSAVMNEMLKPDVPAPAAPTVDKKALGKMVSRIAQTPNPIPAWTVGKDRDPLPGETIPSYTEDDIEALAELKRKLFELENKSIAAGARGEKNQKFEGQIKELIQKIDVLSDAMADTFSPAPNGGK